MGLPLSSCPHLKAKDAGLATVGRRWPLPARLRRLRSASVTDCPIILAQCLPECLLCPESDGGLKWSSQHFILDGRDGGWRWTEELFEVSMRWRKRSCGTVGGEGNR